MFLCLGYVRYGQWSYWQRMSADLSGSLLSLFSQLTEDELLALVSYTYDLRKKFPQADGKKNFAAQLSLSVLNQNEHSEMTVSRFFIGSIFTPSKRVFFFGGCSCSLFIFLLKLEFMMVKRLTIYKQHLLGKKMVARFAYITSRLLSENPNGVLVAGYRFVLNGVLVLNCLVTVLSNDDFFSPTTVFWCTSGWVFWRGATERPLGPF